MFVESLAWIGSVRHESHGKSPFFSELLSEVVFQKLRKDVVLFAAKNRMPRGMKEHTMNSDLSVTEAAGPGESRGVLDEIDRGRYDSGLSRGGGQGTLLSTL